MGYLICTRSFISLKRSLQTFLRSRASPLLVFPCSCWLCCSVNEVVLLRSGGRRSFWRSSATHPCIIDGARKPLYTQTRLGFCSNLCSASTLVLASIVSLHCLPEQQTLFHFYSFINILLVSASCHTTASFTTC